MRQYRIYSSIPLKTDSEIDLPRAAAKHIAQVLRLRVGDAITLFDGTGAEYAAELAAVGKSAARASIGAANWPKAESALQIAVWHGLCRGTRMDTVVQKSTELGAQSIQPLLTKRCTVKLDQARTARRIEHWRRIVIGAAEQSGRCLIPEIQVPQALDDLLESVTDIGTKLIFDTEGDIALSELSLQQEPLIICCGPEGGFSPEELENAERAGFRRVCLGPRILRTETAPIVALSLLQYLMGDLDVAKARL